MVQQLWLLMLLPLLPLHLTSPFVLPAAAGAILFHFKGFSTVIAGVWGTGSGTTAYNENIGAMQITRVGSRLVIQISACWMVAMGLLGKGLGFGV
jgi:hypothetical protein